MVTDFSSKIIAFRFVAPSSATIMVDGVGQFQDNKFQKEVLPFNPNAFLHYEPSSNIYQISNEDGIIEDMTESQIKTLKSYIKTIPELLDITLSCYDPNKNNLHMGVLALSEAKANGYISVLPICDFAVGRFNVETSTWERVKAIITDDGNLIVDPPSYCERCVLFLSDEEWEVFPKPEGFSKDAEIRYDLESEQWIDIRTIKESIRMYKDYVKGTLTQIEMDKYYDAGFDKSSLMDIDYTNEDVAPEFTEAISDDMALSVNSTVSYDVVVAKLKERRISTNATIVELRNFSKMIFNLTIAFTNIPDILVEDPIDLTHDTLEIMTEHFNKFIKSEFGDRYVVE